MNAIEWIVVWSVVALLPGAAGALVAEQKNRNISYWGTWCFLLPPLVIALLTLPQLEQPVLRRPRRPNLDEDEDVYEDVDPRWGP